MSKWQAEPVAEVTDRSADSVPVLLPAVDGGAEGSRGCDWWTEDQGLPAR
jgi:hypothetical protein